MIQLIKIKPIVFRVKNRDYEYINPKYLMPVGSLELVEAVAKASTMVWNIEGKQVSYNQIKREYDKKTND